MPPKYMATTIEAPITIKVYLKVSCLLGQLIFLISKRTSLKNPTIILGKALMFISLIDSKFRAVCQSSGDGHGSNVILVKDFLQGYCFHNVT